MHSGCPCNVKEDLWWPPTLMAPHTDNGVALAHTAIQCYSMWAASGSWQIKTPLKRVIFPGSTMPYLNPAGEMTYKQAVDVIPDGGKIL